MLFEKWREERLLKKGPIVWEMFNVAFHDRVPLSVEVVEVGGIREPSSRGNVCENVLSHVYPTLYVCPNLG